ncbi:hypothetical protein MNBD_GAMMA25-1345 [hydrothermal vent metagenome]|uniref:DUF4124 domain-containing protein n=1 Tax=hydrothermal vent metagenome TaxID=652676 RepID=A0A3B1AV45_9ZZZZ
MNLSFFNVSILTYWLSGFLLLILPAQLPAAEVYKWTNDSGAVHYSDTLQSSSAKQLDIQAAPNAEKVEQAKKREALLRRTADDLELSRQQREAQQRQAEKEKRKQEKLRGQAEREQEEKQTETREGNSEGHYQKQWQQQMPPQYPIPHPIQP